mgnify:CR=1 FL=1
MVEQLIRLFNFNEDVVSTNVVVTDGFFDGFKNDLIVVNTSRGEVVNETYISKLILDGKIFYSCDVLSKSGTFLLKPFADTNDIYVLDYVRNRTLPVLGINGSGQKGIVDYLFEMADFYNPSLFTIVLAEPIVATASSSSST